MFLQKLVKSFRRPHASGGKDPGEAHPRRGPAGEAEPSCPPLEGAGGAAPCGRRAVSSRRRPSVGEGSREERIWWGRARVLLRKRSEWRWLFEMQRRVGGEIKVELARSFVRSRVAQASGVQAGSPLLFRTVAVAARRCAAFFSSFNLQTYHVCVEYGWRSIIAQATHTMPQRIVSSQQIRVVWKAPLPVQQDQISNPTSQGSFPKIDCAKILQHRSVRCIDPSTTTASCRSGSNLRVPPYAGQLLLPFFFATEVPMDTEAMAKV